MEDNNYSTEWGHFKAAVGKGLDAPVTDGMHRLPPEELENDGQLHIFQGLCNAGLGKAAFEKNLNLCKESMISDVPISHVLARRKNGTVYAKMFDMLNQELQAFGIDLTSLRNILNF